MLFPHRGLTERSVQRVGGEGSAPQSDVLVVEEPLEIRVAQDPLTTTMRTPGDDARLALGFLLSERVISSADDVSAVAHCGRPGDDGYGNVLEVTLAPGVRWSTERLADRHQPVVHSSCGVCGRRSIADLVAAIPALARGPRVNADLLVHMPQVLRDHQPAFARCGGTHAAAIFDAGGRLLAVYEDVGRHNAVDKTVGALLQRRLLPAAPLTETDPCVLLVSGRLSFEIVQKAAVARIPVVVSLSAASSLAIDLASQLGITLVSFLRAQTFNLFTHPERIDNARPVALDSGRSSEV